MHDFTRDSACKHLHGVTKVSAKNRAKGACTARFALSQRTCTTSVQSYTQSVALAESSKRVLSCAIFLARFLGKRRAKSTVLARILHGFCFQCTSSRGPIRRIGRFAVRVRALSHRKEEPTISPEWCGAPACSKSSYLLRRVLKVTLYPARNSPLRVAELVPTSSRAKSNNSLARNKLNSDF